MYRGIYLSGSDNNALTDNTANSNNHGIFLYASDNNALTNNIVSNNANYGIYLSASSNNIIYNNLFNNTANFYFYGTIYANNWNTTKTAGTNIVRGSYLAGNYWGKPDGTGFSDTCSDSDGDGICDSEYTLAADNIDHLPLTYPAPTPTPTPIPEFPTMALPVATVIALIALFQIIQRKQ